VMNACASSKLVSAISDSAFSSSAETGISLPRHSEAVSESDRSAHTKGGTSTSLSLYLYLSRGCALAAAAAAAVGVKQGGVSVAHRLGWLVLLARAKRRAFGRHLHGQA
jgi:hypothetical protein